MRRFLGITSCLIVLLISAAGMVFAQKYELVVSDPLTNGTTVGIRGGGEFVSGGGWKINAYSDYIQYNVQTITYGKLEFDVKGLASQDANYKDGDGEICVMYDGSFGDSDKYKNDSDANPYKVYIRKYGTQCARYNHDDGMKFAAALGDIQHGPSQYTARLPWDANHTYHFLVTWKPGAQFDFYLDGALLVTLSQPGTYSPTLHRIKIGTSPRAIGIVGATYSNVKIYKETTTTDKQPPSVPTDVHLGDVSPASIRVIWTASTDNVGVAGYKIYRNGRHANTSTTTFFVDTGLSPSTTYSYTVSAYDSAGNNSAQSSPPPATATTLADTQPPTVPTKVQAVAQSYDKTLVTWTASTDNVGVTGYKIFRNSSLVGTTATKSYTDSGLTPNLTYSYTVSAYDAAGNNSAQSSPPTTATTMQAMDIATEK